MLPFEQNETGRIEYDLRAAASQIWMQVSIEPDSLPGESIPGELSFIEDTAQFTPKNIEVKSDRITQVFATKVRLLAQAERLKPGMEGTVYLNGAHTQVTRQP